MYDSLMKYDQALDSFKQALIIHREVGDCAGEATTFNNIGLAYCNLGKYDQAGDSFRQALVIADIIGATSMQQKIASNIAALHKRQSK